MQFLCNCCQRRVTNESGCRQMIGSAGIHDTAYHMEWALFDAEEMQKPIQERKWSERNEQPVTGAKRILRVKVPFDEEPGGVFTNLYEPWQMFYNGWESAESPADIFKACAVLCRFDAVLWADDYSAFILVEVLKAVPLVSLHQVIPETVTEVRFFEDFGFSDEIWTEYEDEHLLYRTWTAQGDAGSAQLIYTDDRGRRHEVLEGIFGSHDDIYHIGNWINSD